MSKQINGNKIICEGEFEIVNITPKLYDEANKLFENYFMKYETISIACDLLSTEETVAEMKTLLSGVLSDGISFGAIHCETKELAAMCANKMLCPATDCSLSAICSKFRSPNMACVTDYLEQVECTFDIFKEWKLDCALEVTFLSTCTEYSGRGLASALFQHSIDYAREMYEGTLDAKDLESLPTHIRDLKPQAVCSVLTSLFSQKVAAKMGLKNLYQVSHTNVSFQGKTFAEKLDPRHSSTIFAAMKL